MNSPAATKTSVVLQSCNEESTKTLAREIGHRLTPGEAVLLSGPLGSGKTSFVQGLAQGMRVSISVTSPTFTLVHEYQTSGLKLIHVDPYRLENPEQIVELGFDEWFEQDAVLVVEWAERLGPLTPDKYLLVKLEIIGEEERLITLEPHGASWEKLLEELEAAKC